MFTIIISFLTAFIGVLYNKVDKILAFLGGFCSITLSYFFPTYIYIISNELSLLHYKSVISIIIFGTLSIIGIVSGCMSFYDFIT